ncbi:MAG: bifunctional folylpolyglutamate synthase/dihydrofolate synthase [Flavobacteriales bacterium]
MIETYPQAVTWLFEQFPSYQNIGAGAYKPGLYQTEELLRRLQIHPDFERIIHVAGTNGKGSTCAYISSILTEKGEKVGLFSSPHIFDYRERIRINGTQIEENAVIDFCQRVLHLNLEFEPSFFEITFAMALDHFQRNQCDSIVIETGMGGRLDSTNVLTPNISVITNIGLDHTQFLGDTLTEIAGEKAGIIKRKTPVVIGTRQDQTTNVFLEKASEQEAPIYFSDSEQISIPENLELPLLQQVNLKTALSTLHHLQIPVSKELFIRAVQKLSINTGLFGRLSKIGTAPLTYLDVSHNSDGIKATMEAVSHLSFGQLHLIYGAAQDKNVNEILPLFPQNAQIHLCEFKNNRSLSFPQLVDLQKSDARVATVATDINDLLINIRKNADENDLILVTGSFFLLSDIDLERINQ